MKVLTSLIAAMMTTGAAFAATTPTATPASSATPAASTSSTKHEGKGHCEKQAEAKKLAGDEKDKFMTECKAEHKKKAS